MGTRPARTRIAHGLRRTRRHSFPCLIWTGNSRRETRSLASRSERPSPCMRRLFGLNRRKPRWTPVRRWSLPQGPLSYTTAYTPRIGATRTRIATLRSMVRYFLIYGYAAPTLTVLVKALAVKLVVAHADREQTRALAGVLNRAGRAAVAHAAAKVARGRVTGLLRGMVNLRRPGLAVRAFAVVSAGHSSESSEDSAKIRELHVVDEGGRSS